MRLHSKDLLGLRETPDEDIALILDTAKNMKVILDSKNKKAPHLQGKSIVTLFYENSTRTRLSFELAAKYLSAAAANISASSSSVAKRETLIDTGRTIERMGTDIIIIRHPLAGAPHLLAKNLSCSVINGGDGMNEHPTQALLDMFTILAYKGSLKGLKVAIIGDILHSRVARSNIWGLAKMGAEVVLSAPSTLLPVDIEKTGAKIAKTPEDAAYGSDVIMGLRIQLERQKSGLFPTEREYAKFFGVDDRILKLAKPDCIVMHPGPVNRGLELTSVLIDGEHSVIEEQVTNGVAVRMAILYLLSGARPTRYATI
ncbi:MAG: aspartate carbamoyltransferase catalytic subunit [Clostridiales bacterium]|nr:aspartate carbamoyltransferase catalytic subunit [Clostridiales bacterium]